MYISLGVAMWLKKVYISLTNCPQKVLLPGFFFMLSGLFPVQLDTKEFKVSNYQVFVF